MKKQALPTNNFTEFWLTQKSQIMYVLKGFLSIRGPQKTRKMSIVLKSRKNSEIILNFPLDIRIGNQ